MFPFSQERADWIDARLQCLAKMAHDMSANGMSRSIQNVASEYQEAHLIHQAALVAVHSERLQLMSERMVIDGYMKEKKNGR